MNILLHSAVSLVIKSSGTLMWLGAIAVFARLMPQAEFGIFMYGFALIDITSILCLLGFEAVSAKYGAVYWQEKQLGHFLGLLFLAKRSVLITSAALAALGAITLVAMDQLGYLEGISRDKIVFWAIVLASVPASSYVILYQDALRAMRRVVGSLLGQSILRPLFLILFAFIATSMTDLTASIAFGCYFLAMVTTAVIGWQQIRWLIPRSVTSSLTDKPKWLEINRPLVTTSVLTAILQRSDVVLLGFFVGMADIANYAVSQRLAFLLVFLVDAVRIVVSPALAVASHQRNRQHLQDLANQATLLSLMLASGALLVMIGFGQQILSLFGPEYQGAYWVLVALLVGRFAHVVGNSATLIMTLTHLQKERAQIMAAAVLVQCLGVTLAALYGNVLWAALAVSAIWIMLNLTFTMTVRHRLGIFVGLHSGLFSAETLNSMISDLGSAIARTRTIFSKPYGKRN